MRAMPALVLLLVIGCNLPSTSMQSKTPRQLANGGVVDFRVPNPSPAGAGCVGCGTANPSGMAAAPDGTVWYFDVGQQTLARVTTRGEIAQFKVPGTGDGSRAITVAPD